MPGHAGLAEGGRVELPCRLVAGRPLSKRVGSPHARALHDRRSCTPGCGPDQVRTGGLRRDGATGTPLPYGAVRPPRHRGSCSARRPRAVARYASRGSNPDDQVKSLARWPLRERRVGGGGWTCTSGSLGGRFTGGCLRCSATPPGGRRAWRPDCPVCWHLCTGGWPLRGDVLGTCPRSPCTVPAMWAEVSPSAASCLTAVAVPAPGRSLVWWPVAPLPVTGGRVVLGRRVGGRVTV